MPPLDPFAPVERSSFPEPILDRGPGGVASSARNGLRKLGIEASEEALYSELRRAALSGNLEAFKKAFFRGAPWRAPDGGNCNPLALACRASERSWEMVRFLEERGASALGPACRYDIEGGRVFALEIAIHSENWETALCLAPRATRAFIESAQQSGLSGLDGPRQGLGKAQLHGAEPLLQGLRSAFEALSQHPHHDPSQLGPIAEFLEAALDPELLKEIPEAQRRLLFEYRSRQNRHGPLAVAAPFPRVLKALLRAGAHMGQETPNMDAITAARVATEQGASLSLTLLAEHGAKPLMAAASTDAAARPTRFEERLASRRALTAPSAPPMASDEAERPQRRILAPKSSASPPPPETEQPQPPASPARKFVRGFF